MVLGLIYTVGLDIFLILMGSAAFLGLCFLFFKEVIYPAIKKEVQGSELRQKKEIDFCSWFPKVREMFGSVWDKLLEILELTVTRFPIII
ncbi:hypothetical protein LEP1GSC151_3281 [Leptospira interrogans serovar Grippotyphosa str. LT2186]|uniref:Uncharacterized protein n=1 Tax=Leptospira interrogans serovar Grippotyphosa str. LT2186 TaxID=1001599 RepID=M3I653_LEPIR|nr:hypothetical protein LEP1GSC151_3281 [Leptospira interrogans serovar Grippotyphosa str. LT2186]